MDVNIKHTFMCTHAALTCAARGGEGWKVLGPDYTQCSLTLVHHTVASCVSTSSLDCFCILQGSRWEQPGNEANHTLCAADLMTCMQEYYRSTKIHKI